jgi:hypothetical protein
MSWLREPDAEPIPGYRLIEPLGAGGFGEVWKCVAPGGIFKAIKFVYGNLESEEPDAARADQEYRALQRIKEVRHPFVLSMDRIEVVAGDIAIVMELADKSLHDVYVECQAQGLPGIPRADLHRYLSDAADALDYLNSHFNLQHLDVKPRNLFVIADRVKVADFGLVKNLERPSSAGVMGGVTPIYAAPETFGGKLSRHCDQYSLAVVYMELLTGRRPFSGKNVRQIALQHMSEPPDLGPVPEADRPAVARALAKDPNKRFPNCLAFMRALGPAGASAPVEYDPDAEVDLGRSGGDAPSFRGKIPTDTDDAPPTAIIEKGPAKRASIADLAVPPAARPVPGPTRPVIDLRAPRPDAPATGLLRPVLVIGVGSFGRQALMELRCRLLDRFGDLQQVPAYRYLYLDSDPEALQKATAGTSEVALSTADVFPLPLQPVANYRRRMLDHLSEWLPREKLYSIPRSLQPLGSRALGRLAFCDNFLRLQSRLRRELSAAAQAEALQQSAAATRLAPGENCPRVFVLASATEGVSGILTDLAFTLRRTLDQLNFPYAQSVAVVYCGTPFDPATPAQDQSNLYATLTELNHYQDDGVAYQAQYGPDGPVLTDHRPPFSGIYLTHRHQRTPAGLRECLAHLATFLTQDIVSPLGRELEQRRDQAYPTRAVRFRSFGTSTSWYPRGLLLRVAARMACSRLLEVWRSADPPTALPQAEAAVAQATADAGLRVDALLTALDRGAATPGDGSPVEATDRFLASLETQAAVVEEPGPWAAQALEKVKEWAGSGTGCDPDTTWRKSRFYRGMQLAAKQLSDAWDEKLAGAVIPVLSAPGHRLSNAEAALSGLIGFCRAQVNAQRQLIERHYEVVQSTREQLLAALAECQAGAKFSLFGGGRQRGLKSFLTLAAQFARLRVTQDLHESVLQFYQFLQARLDDRVNDLGFARQRLKALQQVLASPVLEEEGGAFDDLSLSGSPSPYHDPFWHSVQTTPTVEVVLPGGVRSLEDSAEQFVDSLQPEHWLSLDEALQDHVLTRLGNVIAACTGNMNLTRHMGVPLVEEAAQYLADILPITDVAQVQFSAEVAGGADLGAHCRKLHSLAAPAVGGDVGDQLTYLLVPDSDDGREFGDLAEQTVPGLRVLHGTATTELTFCRELAGFNLDEFRKLLDLSRTAYQASAPQPATSPHARFDVIEWVPLEP